MQENTKHTPEPWELSLGRIAHVRQSAEISDERAEWPMESVARSNRTTNPDHDGAISPVQAQRAC